MNFEEKNLQKAEVAIGELQTQVVDLDNNLPFSFFDKRSNKTTKLVANSGATDPIKGKHRWFEYTFVEPVLIGDLTVATEGYAVYKDFEYEITEYTGSTRSGKLSPTKSGLLVLTVDRMVQAIKFLPPKQWLVDGTISQVQVRGLAASSIDQVLDIAKSVDAYKTRVLTDCNQALENAKKANSQVADLRLEAENIAENNETHKAALAELREQTNVLKSELSQLTSHLAERKKDERDLTSRIVTAEERLGVRERARVETAKELSALQSQLKELEDDVNMFPTDLKGFVAQGARNNRTYLMLASIPIVILVIMFVLVIGNSADLTSVLVNDPDARIGAIIMTRMPYVILVGTIIAACYGLTSLAINEVVRINKQRLDLTKLSILASDVTKASQDGLRELSEKELFEARTNLKMILLKDHLKTYLTDDFKMPKLGLFQRSSNRKAAAKDVESNAAQEDSVED